MGTIRRFYADFHSHGGNVSITGEELHHLRKVLRGKVGDPVEVTNGRGKLITGEIQDISPDRALVSVKKTRSEKKPPVAITLAPSLLKRKPMNQMIEKLSEMGVDEIRPVVYRRTDTDMINPVPEKWLKIVHQSLKINDRLWCTEVFAPVGIEEMMAIARKARTKFFLDLQSDPPEDITWIPPALTLIGPPGDFTDAERRLIEKNGFRALRISDCTLKTETAAISVAAILKFQGSIIKTND